VFAARVAAYTRMKNADRLDVAASRDPIRIRSAAAYEESCESAVAALSTHSGQ
jgi:hypothetical protein